MAGYLSGASLTPGTILLRRPWRVQRRGRFFGFRSDILGHWHRNQCRQRFLEVGDRAPISPMWCLRKWRPQSHTTEAVSFWQRKTSGPEAMPWRLPYLPDRALMGLCRATPTSETSSCSAQGETEDVVAGNTGGSPCMTEQGYVPRTRAQHDAACPSLPGAEGRRKE